MANDNIGTYTQQHKHRMLSEEEDSMHLQFTSVVDNINFTRRLCNT